MDREVEKQGEECAVKLPLGKVTLEGNLCIPENARVVVVFAHGSGSSRHSPRNRYVAQVLREAGLATLLFDLLTPEEETEDARTARLRFDIGLLSDRLVKATGWLRQNEAARGLSLGYFGASTGAAAALMASVIVPKAISAIVSRGGRPDLASEMLDKVRAPTLLIVGGNDFTVIELNREALARLGGEKALVIIPGASHLFKEPGTLEEVAEHAREWFLGHLGR